MGTKYYDWTAYHAGVHGNKVAIVDLDTAEEVTYAVLDDRAARLAQWLQAQGVAKGDRVTLLTPNCPEVFEAQFACSKIGAICIPLNWRLTVPELEYILGDAAPKVLIYDAKFADAAEQLINLCSLPTHLRLDSEDAACAYKQAQVAMDGNYQAVECTHDDVAMIMYTSGTTGHPKGAMITFGMNFYNAVNLGIPAGISANTVQLVVLPLFHGGHELLRESNSARGRTSSADARL